MEIFASNFLDKYSVDGHSVQYANFIEIAQGGPEVGMLIIDERAVGEKGDYFGGPPFFHQGKMFASRLKKGLVGRHFQICVINLSDLSIKEIGDKEDLVLISKVDDSTVYFFEDNPNAKLKSLRWK